MSFLRLLISKTCYDTPDILNDFLCAPTQSSPGLVALLVELSSPLSLLFCFRRSCPYDPRLHHRWLPCSLESECPRASVRRQQAGVVRYLPAMTRLLRGGIRCGEWPVKMRSKGWQRSLLAFRRHCGCSAVILKRLFGSRSGEAMSGWRESRHDMPLCWTS